MGRHRKKNDRRWIEIDGERRMLSDWAREYGISRQLLFDRIRRGWDVELAVVTPPRKYNASGCKGRCGRKAAKQVA